jgi:hypothetical protein
MARISLTQSPQVTLRRDSGFEPGRLALACCGQGAPAHPWLRASVGLTGGGGDLPSRCRRWSVRYQGKDEIAGFLRRFVRAGIQLEPQEIVVKGPPWNTRALMRFTDQATAPDGTVVYANRGVILATAAWGRFQEDYLDTQKVAAFDEYLSSRGPTGA